MKSLLFHEIRKHILPFNIIFVSSLLVLNIAVSFYVFRGYFSAESRSLKQGITDLLELKENNPEEYQKILAEYNETNNGSDVMRMYLSNDEAEAIDYSGINHVNPLQYLDELENYPLAYRRRISSLLRETAALLETAEEDSFTQKYYYQICESYVSLSGLELPVTYTEGWASYFEYHLSTLFLIVAMVGTQTSVFPYERKHRNDSLLRVSKYGGKETRCGKILYVVVSSAVLTLMFTVAPMLPLSLTCGFSGITEPLQLLNSFILCPLRITIGEYFLLYLLARILVCTALTLLICFVSYLFSDEKPAFVTAVVLFISGVLSNKIAPGSDFFYIKKFSILNIIEIQILFDQYRVLHIGKLCINYALFVGITILFILATSVILTVFAPCIEYEKYNRTENSNRKRTYRFWLICFEVHKHFVARKQYLILLAACVFKIIACAFALKPPDYYVEKQYRNYIKAYAGTVDETKHDAINNEMLSIQQWIAEYDSAKNLYIAGKISDEKFKEYKNRYDYARYNEFAIKRLQERCEYLLNASDEVPAVEFIYDEGLDRLFSSAPDIISILLITLTASNLFACETENDFSRITRTAKRGRKTIFNVKLLYSILISILFCILFTAIEAAVLIRYYDMSFLNVPARSMPIFSSVAADHTIWNMMILRYSLSLAGYVMLFVVTGILSALFRTQARTIIVTTAAVVMTYALNINTAVPLFSLISLITPSCKLCCAFRGQILISVATCFFLAITSCMIAHRTWCGCDSKRG